MLARATILTLAYMIEVLSHMPDVSIPARQRTKEEMAASNLGTPGFHRGVWCDVCQRKTVQYKPHSSTGAGEDFPIRCTEHTSAALEHAKQVVARDGVLLIAAVKLGHANAKSVADFDAPLTKDQANRLQALATKWREGEGYLDCERKQNHSVELPDEWIGEVFGADTVTQLSVPQPIIAVDPTKLYCSFCYRVVDEATLTRGKSKMRISKVIDTEMIAGELQEIIRHVVSQPKLIACPDCVLQLKPILCHERGQVSRDGHPCKQCGDTSPYKRDGKIIQQAFTAPSRV